jgi:uncharacterized protein (DUF1697 family)
MTGRYVALLRGINVGGKNKVTMASLRSCLEELGAERVQTYIASGNVMFDSPRSPVEMIAEIQRALPGRFALDAEMIRVLVLSHEQLRRIVDDAPEGFGREPDRYHCDAIFLMGIAVDEAITAFNPREGVDRVWPGDLVVYSQRLSAQRTKSRLSSIVASPLYGRMTIRSWATTQKLLALMDDNPGC